MHNICLHSSMDPGNGFILMTQDHYYQHSALHEVMEQEWTENS